ncbi:g12956 [Coccomyxa viridis]|uniref:G12956 protein n=1 Tax=Coccomyxa viridis TaxID=1274662 RepID=A0ABP1GH67_9CHLO
MKSSRKVPAWTICTILAAISCGVYLNTLQAGFTFDDFFAVIKNDDVSNEASSITNLFFNDFWGQPLLWPTSNKSYRPLTILALRVQFSVGNRILRAIGWKKVQRMHDSSDGRDDLDPVSFHFCNVIGHAVVTCLIYFLAVRLCCIRDSLAQAAKAASPAAQKQLQPEGGMSDGSDRGERRWKGSTDSLTGLRQRRVNRSNSDLAAFGVRESKRSQRVGQEGRPSDRQQAEGFLAALIFAVHPIHTEAVAGIVGQAELISAGLSILALLTYFRACLPGEVRTQDARQGDIMADLQSWGLVGCTVLLIWAAALAKEIGITVIATAWLFDLYLVPWEQPFPQGGLRSLRHFGRQIWYLVRTPKATRMVVLGVALVIYVKARSFLAVDQLVRIYREVENPVAFATGWTKLLSLWHLHAQYAGLMVAPIHMCADWSYRCVPLVEHFSDPRNLASLLTYGWVLWGVWAGRPWEIIAEMLGYGRGNVVSLEAVASTNGGANGMAAAAPLVPKQSQRAAPFKGRWRSFVAVGLIIAPFLPASNLFFWVGTYIGERLIYAPSIGFCILVAELLANLAGDALPQILLLWYSVGGQEAGLGVEVKGAKRGTGRDRWRGLAAGVLMALLLGAYTWRTIDRNWDWEDEERLFRAALKVCPNGAKVRLNMGITERRYQNWDAALGHYLRAKELAGRGFCEPDYWIGVTRINRGVDIDIGVEEVEKALDCPHIAADAALALNRVYSGLHEMEPEGGRYLMRWARILMRPSLLHIEQTCEALEQALMGDTSEAVLPPEARMRETIFPCTDYLANPTNHRALSSAGHPQPSAVCGGQTVRHQILAAKKEGTAPPPLPMPDVSNGHVLAIHRLHAADAEDAWLQREWGEIQVAQGNLNQAATHFEVAGKLMMRQLSRLVGKNLSMGIDAETASVGELTPQQLSIAATTAFNRGIEAGHTHPCYMYHQMCEGQATLKEVLELSGDLAGAEAAFEAGKRCMVAVSQLEGCHEYVTAVLQEELEYSRQLQQQQRQQQLQDLNSLLKQ